MREVGAFDAKNKLSALLDDVEHGEEVVITRHGKPGRTACACNTDLQPGTKHARRRRVYLKPARESRSVA